MTMLANTPPAVTTNAAFPAMPVNALRQDRVLGPEAMSMAYAPQETIYMEEDPADYVFMVRSGIVKICKFLADGRRQITGFAFPGDMFGLESGGAYSYSAETVTQASVEALPHRRLDAVFAADPALQRLFLNTVVNGLVNAQEQMLLLGRRTARERLAWFLLMLAERGGNDEGADDGIRLAMTASDIADFLGLTIETVSRMTSQLKREGVIRSAGYRRLAIVDREALQGIAAGD